MPRAPIQVSLGSHTGTGAGTAFALGGKRLDGGSISIQNTFVGTVAIEVSHDGGTTYVAARAGGSDVVLSGLTAVRTAELAGCPTHIRSNCTAYTSGTIDVKLNLPAT